MIGVMVPSVFAQIDVTVTPYKESHYMDELNWVTVELSKVVPNTNLCIQKIQNNIILSENDGKITYSKHGNGSNGGLETGNYQVRVFYGECNTENSFGNGYATIMFQKEISPVSKFIQDNYFPERIDVGIDYQKDELFTYHSIGGGGCVSNIIGEDYLGRSNSVCGIDSAVKQTWSSTDNTRKGMEIIITHGDISVSDDSKHLLERQPVNDDEFICYIAEPGYCFSDDLLVKITALGFGSFRHERERAIAQVADIWMPAIIDKIKSNPIPSQSKLSSLYSTQSPSVTATTSDDQWSSGDSLSIKNNQCGTGTFLKNNVCVVELTCGKGTTEKNGQCVVKESKGGGCLIATATYGSELAKEVQQLRELRDNQLLQTASGKQFMGTFNDIYYSFSPTIADYERENPLFKEVVKIAITPMISTLSLMENANSESEVLSIGISVIMLNLGMYLGVPAVVIVGIRKIK